MQIVIHARGLLLTPSLRDYIERRLRFAVDWANHHISTLSVHLVDVNGPRGGEDKCCQIRVAIPGANDIVIEDTQVDMFVAIDRAADRAGRTLARRMARQRQRLRDRERITDRPDGVADSPRQATTSDDG
ncbi:MAG: HPF/RaiA family ribosome-associated protein [Candidatus Accumulibacter sp.]|nr:HPF/RaiA family ribosome-associated protein [Accumulibacter sp.]